ncbi:DUF6053 domain-containing protein [Lysobacter enzymogenes]|uniref:DUF6053 domain-containing protein n=1 Tax=Lysobacter enzymogenes TaxID=69 RepID=UPI003D2F6AEF
MAGVCGVARWGCSGGAASWNKSVGAEAPPTTALRGHGSSGSCGRAFRPDALRSDRDATPQTNRPGSRRARRSIAANHFASTSWLTRNWSIMNANISDCSR